MHAVRCGPDRIDAMSGNSGGAAGSGSAAWPTGVDFAAIARELPDVVLVLDVDKLKVRDVNRGPEGAFGFTRDELLARDGFALFPRWWDAEKTLRPGAAVATFVKQKTGDEAPVDIRMSRARLGDGRDVILACVREGRPLSEVERELADVNTYLHAIVENIPDMIFVKDAETHAFRRFNRAGEELLGFSRGELLGKTDHDFYPKEQADFFHEKDEETLRSRAILDIPSEPIQTKNNGERVLHTRKIPIYDDAGKPLYLLGISEDITERVRAEQVARELADVVRYLRDAVVTWRPDGSVASWNPAAARLFGLAALEALGAPMERFVPDGDLVTFRERNAKVAAGEDVPVQEVTRLRADGREIEVEESTFAVLDADGKVVRIASVARDLTELARLRRAAQVLSGAGSTPPAMPANLSAKMQEATTTADLVAQDGRATVLLLGETGVGKSWMAKRIHQRSPRRDKPFFEINCAGLGPQLIESELFGHERGSFTGATGQKRGLVETAEGGTLFLDEIGELSLAVQAQLLTFLDTHRFRRVGGTRLLEADVRLVAATNVDLKQASDDGRFRRDLYYRLNVVPIEIPALRERREEVEALAREVLVDLGRRSGNYRPDVTHEALRALEGYAWPGNIRELRNALERALILARGAPIDVHHLPAELANPTPVRGAPTGQPRSLDEIERQAIVAALGETDGNRTRAAERLGISRSTMKRKLAAMGLKDE
ncbi:MAG: domain S-box [Labilithrix sp.]|nr:domain S-box [Labilithrix sp.]